MSTTWHGRELDFERAFHRVELHLERRYELPVVIADVADPNTGDFDGVSISVDHELELDVALFVLAHLFGHTVQWACDPVARDLGIRFGSVAPPPELFDAVRDYEHQASRYAVALFRESGLPEFDQWLSDWSAADWKYLEHVYRSGERLDFRRFLVPGGPVLEPLPIPEFRPRRWVSRFSF